MLLLWQNNVPVCIEVLLCPDCRRGRNNARSVEFSTIPEPGSVLLEQWTVSISASSARSSAQQRGPVLSSRGLFQAVRSYLHFSQLCAWFSSSGGERPKNVLYRITIPGETFSSKFKSPPEEHSFPPAGELLKRYIRAISSLSLFSSGPIYLTRTEHTKDAKKVLSNVLFFDS